MLSSLQQTPNPGMMNFPYISAQGAAELLTSGEMTSVEMTEAAISRIIALDGAVNAVVVKDFDGARSAAKRADAALTQGQRLPLLGVPITVKESFQLGALPTSWGIPAFRNWFSRNESLAVQRLKRAGAVVLGKTNVSEGLADWQCANRIFGRTNNPWDLARTPGGSSGGSVASLAAGFAFLELGSDVAGSIRIPSHFCGVFGHRPTYGLISTQGYGFPTKAAPSDLSVIGPMTRSAKDLSLALDLLAGPGEPESIAYQLHLPGPRHQRLTDFRCLLLDEHPLVKTAEDVMAPIHEIGNELRKLCVRVATSSAALPNLAEVAEICVRLLTPMTLSRVTEEGFAMVRRQADSLPPEDASLGAMALRSGVGTHREWLRANEARTRLSILWQQFFQEWDIIICPVAPTVAYFHNDQPRQSRSLDVDGVSVPYFDQIVWSTLAIPCGLPATVAPAGLTKSGLPVGVQIIGPVFEDRTTISFAMHLERLLGGFSPPAWMPVETDLNTTPV